MVVQIMFNFVTVDTANVLAFKCHDIQGAIIVNLFYEIRSQPFLAKFAFVFWVLFVVGLVP